MSMSITNEPTEAQVAAAAKALRADEGFMEEVHSALEVSWSEYIARLVLVAAQGAAPQAEAYDHCCQHPRCPGGSLCCCASEQRLRDCWNQWREEIAGDSKQAFRDGYQAGQNDPAPWLTAPVLPSSGVDEEKLAEVTESIIRENWEMFDDRRHQAQVIARAVAEWLKGHGSAARE